MFTFIGYDLLVHYIYIISVLRQRRRSFLLDWGGGGAKFERCKKKNWRALRANLQLQTFRAWRAVRLKTGILVKLDRRLCLKTLNKSSSCMSQNFYKYILCNLNLPCLPDQRKVFGQTLHHINMY